MTSDDRKVIIFSHVDEAITALRLLRSKVQKGKHVDPSDLNDINEIMSSIRHNCDMHNTERVRNMTEG